MRRRYPENNNWTLEAVRSTVRTHPVPCHSLGDEVRRHGLLPPAVILLDIEGLDCEVVAEMDGCELAPHVLQFEHTWCRKDARAEATRHVLARRCGDSLLSYSNATFPKWSDTAFYRRTASFREKQAKRGPSG